MHPSAQAIGASARPKPSVRAGVLPASDASAGTPSVATRPGAPTPGVPRSGLGSRSLGVAEQCVQQSS